MESPLHLVLNREASRFSKNEKSDPTTFQEKRKLVDLQSREVNIVIMNTRKSNFVIHTCTKKTLLQK